MKYTSIKKHRDSFFYNRGAIKREIYHRIID